MRETGNPQPLPQIRLAVMLERIAHPDGVVFYQSPLLAAAGVPHAFTTRIGGVSPPPFDTLNFQPASRSVSHLGQTTEVGKETGKAGGKEAASKGIQMASAGSEAASGLGIPLRSSAPPWDEHESALKNFARLAAALGCGDRRTICLWQVHGKGVCLWPDEARDATPAAMTTVVAQADALMTIDPGVLLGVRVADCVPILLADESGRAVAAIHAGWRGITAHILAATLYRLHTHFGIQPRRLLAAIGPCISAAHFEVGLEVAAAFDEAKLSAAVHREYEPRPHIDLQAAVAIQLERAGLRASRIDRNDLCTHRDQAEFFSHRRDAGQTGRMVAVIGGRASRAPSVVAVP